MKTVKYQYLSVRIVNMTTSIQRLFYWTPNILKYSLI